MTRTLTDLIRLYVTIRPLSPGAEYLLGRTVTLYSGHLQHAARISDLADDAVSAWLRALESTHAPYTRTGHRTRILTLWRFAARRKLCQPPGEVRREPPPEPQPQTWTVEEVGRLVRATALLPIGGPWFRALILTCYESGLRRGDAWGLTRDQIGLDGVIRLRQRKTGWPIEPRIRPETAAAVLELPGWQPLACPWGCRKYTMLWRLLRRLAGLDCGACQQLRRTGATWVAAESGLDAASRWLGHRSPEMLRFYVDRGRLTAPARIPPRVA